MARDRIHNIVVEALETDDWEVNNDPLYIKYDINQGAFEIDLGAEKLIAAEKENTRIAIEIKTFVGSIGNQFHTALGQFLDYEAALAASPADNDRTLYIALPEEAYNKLSSIPFFQQRIQEHGLRFISIDLVTKNIVAWIESKNIS